MATAGGPTPSGSPSPAAAATAQPTGGELAVQTVQPTPEASPTPIPTAFTYASCPSPAPKIDCVRISEAGATTVAVGADVAVSGSRMVVAGWTYRSDILGETASIWVTSDGKTWMHGEANEGFTQPSEIRSVIAGGPGFMAVGSTGGPGLSSAGNTAAVWTSVDGRSWIREATFPDASSAWLSRIVSTSSGFVIIGSVVHSDHQRAMAWWSRDGVSWTAAKLPADDPSWETWMSDIAVGSAGLVAVGTAESTIVGVGVAPAVWYSIDGRSWDRGVLPTVGVKPAVGFGSAEMLSVASNGRRYVALGGYPDEARAWIWTSTDGRSWSLRPNAVGESEYLTALTSDGSSFWAAGMDITLSCLATSPDGSAWTWIEAGPKPISTPIFEGIRATPKGIVAVGVDSYSLVIWVVG